MNEIFGIPMNSIMAVLLVMLGICLLVVLWIAWRRTLLFKMGLRNVPRRPAQTILVIIGLMLSTLIIAAAFGTGDTIDNSVTSLTYKTLGPVDELVLYSNSEDGEATTQRWRESDDSRRYRATHRPALRRDRSDSRHDADAVGRSSGLPLRGRCAGQRAGPMLTAAARTAASCRRTRAPILLGIDPALAGQFWWADIGRWADDRSWRRGRGPDRHQRIDGR